MGLYRTVGASVRDGFSRSGPINDGNRQLGVFTRDDPGDTVIVVISGRVKVVVRSADGGDLTLTVIQPGGVFGELSVGQLTDSHLARTGSLSSAPLATAFATASWVPSRMNG